MEYDPMDIPEEPSIHALAAYLVQVKAIKISGCRLPLDCFAKMPQLEFVHILDSIIIDTSIRMPQVKRLNINLYLRSDSNIMDHVLNICYNATELVVDKITVDWPFPQRMQVLDLKFKTLKSTFAHCHVRILNIRTSDCTKEVLQQVCSLQFLQCCKIEADKWCDNFIECASEVLEMVDLNTKSTLVALSFVKPSLRHFKVQAKESQVLQERLLMSKNLQLCTFGK